MATPENGYETTPIPGSAEFFGIEPGSPDEAAFDAQPIVDRPHVDASVVIEDFKPSGLTQPGGRPEPYSLEHVSYEDQLAIRELIEVKHMDPETAIEMILSDSMA